jgi:hypothetical protein
MDRADEPSERDLGHDVLHALESLGGARPVIEKQKDSRGHLDEEEEERHPAEVVEDRVAVDRHFLLRREMGDVVPSDAVPQPGGRGQTCGRGAALRSAG